MEQINLTFILNFLFGILPFTAQDGFQEWKNMSESEKEVYTLEQGQDILIRHMSEFNRKGLLHQFTNTTFEQEDKQLRSEKHFADSEKNLLKLTFFPNVNSNTKMSHPSDEVSASVDFDLNTGTLIGSDSMKHGFALSITEGLDRMNIITDIYVIKINPVIKN